MLKTASWPLDKLVPYARNPRDNDAQIARMAAAIREFGFRIPIVVRSDGTVVDGHLRLKAARQLGLAEVPVVLADELSEAQVKAFRLLANRSATWAAWDEDLLTLELEELQAMAYDVGHTGFDAAEIDALLAEPASKGLTDPDDGARAAGRADHEAGRRVGAGPASADVRRQHPSRRCPAPPGRGASAPDGHRSALRRRLRPGLAQPGAGREEDPAHRQGAQ